MIPNNYNNNQYQQTVYRQEGRDRNRLINLHLSLLMHTISCQGCQSNNCGRMRDFLNHYIQHLSPAQCQHCRRAANMIVLFVRNYGLQNQEQMDID